MLFITALVIFDETQTGLGRTGEHFWGFQNYGNIVPDILTCGRPLGAGHPIGACITSSRVARRYVHIFVFFIPKRAKKNHFVFLSLDLEPIFQLLVVTLFLVQLVCQF